MFLVFACDDYYPAGGSGDFVGAFDTMEQAQAAARTAYCERSEIYDVAAKAWHKVDRAVDYEG